MNLLKLYCRHQNIKKGALSDAGKAKIRYAGGMCIAKTRKHICNILREKLGDPCKSTKEKVKTAERQLNFIYSLDASYEEKQNASLEKKTFEEIERRQNITKCFT